MLNIRGLKPRTVPSKVPYIGDLLTHTNQLFFALTETWLKDQLDAEIKIDEYQVFRSDCQKTRTRGFGRDRGGVALYLRNDAVPLSEIVLQFSNGAVEALGIHVKQKNILILVVYRHPDDAGGGNRSTTHEFKEAVDEIRSTLSNLQAPYPEVIVCGDFNLPHLDWPNGTLRPGASKDEKSMAQILEDLANDHFLFQQVTGPTHRHGNTLDLCFSNNPQLMDDYHCRPTIFSDHYLIEGSAIFKSSTSEQESFRQPHGEDGISATFDALNFFSEEVDWTEIQEDLSKVNWNMNFSCLSPSEMFSKLIEKCTEISKKHVPERKSNRKKKSRIPRTRRTLMRRRSKVNKQLCSNVSDSRRIKLETEAQDIERKLQESYRNEKSEMEHKAVNAIKKNSKYFFSYAKKFCSLRTGIGPLLDSAKTLISCPSKMADMLSAQYTSVFSIPKETIQEPWDYFPYDQSAPGTSAKMMDIPFTRKDIQDAMAEIPLTAAAGPDRFPAIFLKMCREQLSEPLYIMWRRSLDTGTVPQVLKTANIIPIHKGNARTLPKNYRPIALTSHLIKVFEKVMKKYIVAYMEEYRLFNPTQHGFLFGRSCLSQLLNHYEAILHLMENGHDVDVIYLDFAKAFDKVDFAVTLRKIQHLGIQGKIGRWIYNFITGRSQTVLVNGARSTRATVKSGVPQGSVLGPLLFLILIGDIDQNVANAFLSSFADDTRVGNHVDNEDEARLLQHDLNAVYQWTETNNMELNADKFEHLHYSPTGQKETEYHYKSSTGNHIEEQTTVKDLGVTMSNCGSFKKHIHNVVKNARSQAAWILRTFATRDKTPMLTLWRSLVQCKLDYCSQLWNPSAKCDIQALEMVQRSFIRKIRGTNHLTYWEQLQELRMYSQERRRERYMIIYVWRILEEQVPNVCNVANASGCITARWHGRRGRLCDIPSIATRSSPKIKSLREASLPVKGQRLFNTLPQEIRNITGCKKDIFKRELDKYLKDIPDEPQIPGYTELRRVETNSLVDMTRLRISHKDHRVEGLGDNGSSGSRGCVANVAMA